MATQKAKTQAQVQNDSVKQMEAAVNAGKETVENFVKAGTEATTKNVEKAMRLTHEQIEKANSQAFKTVDEFYAFGKDNVDAAVQAGSIYLKGIEAINREILSYTQKSVEASLANAKAALSAKSLQELLELQNGFTKQAFDEAVAETTKISELSTKVANDAAKPISERVKVTVERFVKTAA